MMMDKKGCKVNIEASMEGDIIITDIHCTMGGEFMDIRVRTDLEKKKIGYVVVTDTQEEGIHDGFKEGIEKELEKPELEGYTYNLTVINTRE